jgi:Fic family protein
MMRPEELAALDATYKRIPSAAEWPNVVDASIWEVVVHALKTRRENTSPETLAASIRRAMQAAAIDSGAIEGLYEVDRGVTISILSEAATWEATVASHDSNTRELIEAQLAGYELALDAATTTTPVSEALIRRIHDVVCAPQQTVRVLTSDGFRDQPFTGKGAYKTQPNHVKTARGDLHAYAPVALVPDEMHRLVEELGSPAFSDLHPVAQAAYAHFALAHIHPFQDGNGRVARVLASVFLCRAVSIPLVVFQSDKDDYLNALEVADGGLADNFVAFILGRATRSVDLVADHLRPDATERLSALGELAIGHRGLTYAELDQIASRIMPAVEAVFEAELARLRPPPHVQTALNASMTDNRRDEGSYRSIVGQSRIIRLVVSSQAPVTGQAIVDIDIAVAKNKDNAFPYLLMFRTPWGVERLPILLSDVRPDISDELRLRMAMRARGVLGEMVNKVAADADATLRGSGYV